jgi:hypothetical protein
VSAPQPLPGGEWFERAKPATAPDPAVDVNEQGGRQSAVPYRCDLMPPRAYLRVAEVLKKGAHHGEENWRLITVREHLNHALGHVHLHMTGDTSEDHLANASCRMLMALEMQIVGATPKPKPDYSDAP